MTEKLVKKRSTGPRAGDKEPERPPREKRSSLLRRLLGGARRDKPADLPAPGQRSGEGTESLEQYLERERNTRPGPLE